MNRFLRVGVFPAGILFAFLPVEAADAARCPAGQMYRVSLSKCVQKSGNEQFLRRPRKDADAEKPAARKLAARSTERPARAIARPPQRDADIDDEVTSYAPRRDAGLPFEARSEAPAQSPWPFGALR